MGTAIVVGGTGGLGRAVAAHLAARGDAVVVTSRDKARAEAAAAEIGPEVRGLAVDLSRPATIAADLAEITEVDHLVITAISQAVNPLASFDVAAAVTAHTVKLVGYAEVVRALRDRFRPGASVVLFGGVAKDRPYPGSTVVTTHNAGLSGLVKTLAVQIAPHRVNVLHPGIVGDSPKWRDQPDHPDRARSPIGRLVNVAEIVDATDFLLRNTGVNAQELNIEGGLLAG
ncbi:SDR family oxidoreductase [Asanoa iriomotensis]|uniref:Short-chain dehydrogenase n=1 Tax=Asanoa iriomotensis TaxID=234613 RepID=A0ABQ4C8G5_9ACTN|nr:SDR family oxidoreductase [Asanoa iriomotensis]GIF59072.1 short-chain dehydrogenase [Asanoa iriomotensis]